MPNHSAARLSTRFAAALLGLGVAFVAQAATVWNEGSQGDLSNNGLAPTLLPFAPGSNEVFGATGDSGQGVDRDYFVFVVPDGMALTGLTLLDGTTVSGGSSFLGMQAGPQLTVTPSGVGVEQLLGFLHYNGDQVGTDLLPSLVFGFTGSLPSGMYSVWTQETGGPVRYGFDFVITAVPEPSVAGLLAFGMLGVALAARRRRG